MRLYVMKLPDPTRRHCLEQLAGKLYRGELREARIDSRQVQPGDIFFALPGSKVHGNDFIPQALAQGARFVISEAPARYHLRSRILKSPDVLGFLQDLAREIRSLSGARFVAVTGSNGKTTTKDMLELCLKTLGPTLATAGNLNNHIGVPLTLCRLRRKHRFAVIEMGTSGPGEIELLSSMARPHVGVITSIAEAHLLGLGGKLNIAREKSAIFTPIEKGGSAFVTMDVDSYACVRRACANLEKTLVDDPDTLSSAPPLLKNGSIQWRHAGARFTLNSPAQHNVQNARIAIAVALQEGAQAGKLSLALTGWKPSKHRMSLSVWKRRTILDDSYNANPASMHSALEAAVSMKKGPHRRLIALIGDMKELGKKSLQYHRNLGEALGRAGVDLLLTLGKDSRSMLGDFERRGGHMSKHCENIDELADMVRHFSKPNDIILIKGSRSMGMERVLDNLQAS